jgi:hypothetical protein
VPNYTHKTKTTSSIAQKFSKLSPSTGLLLRIRRIVDGKRFRRNQLHLMKTSHAWLFAVTPLFLASCAVSPDYSNYDWHSRGGMVEEQDRTLASARIEPFQTRSHVHANEPLTPVGAPPAREQEVIIDPSRSGRTRSNTVVLR